MTTPSKDAPPPLARLPEEWAKEVVRLGGRTFHGKQVFRWLMARGVFEPAQMTDLPKDLRRALAEGGVEPVLTVLPGTRAADRTRKLLVRLRDGATVETVLIPGVSGERRLGRGVQDETESDDADAAAAVDDEDDDEDQGDENPQGKSYLRVTQCISTQVGCAMGCVFCASGLNGVMRNLTSGEILEQLVRLRNLTPPGERLSHIVVMGMGEPLYNYENVAKALRIIMDHEGIGLSRRRITLSTSGVVPEIPRAGA